MVNVDPAHVGPAPAGRPLRVRVPCRMSGNRRVPPTRHGITIHPDWSVATPHDVDSERIAVALGGHSSCVGLVDAAVPALKRWIELTLRVRPVGIRALSTSGWAIDDKAHCCRQVSFAGAADAAIHARSIPHVAALFDADWDLLTSLAAGSINAYGSRFDMPERGGDLWVACGACRAGLPDVAYLWDCGLTSAAIVAIHARTGATKPLSRAFYTAVIAGSVDPDEPGIGEAAAAAPDDTPADPSVDWSLYLKKRIEMENTA